MRNFPLKGKVFYLTFAAMIFTFSLSATVFSQAFTATSNEFVPFFQTSFVPCANGGAGETVLISGIVHVQTHMTVNQNRLISKFHFQPQGATGQGLLTGDVYHAVGQSQLILSFPLADGASTSTFVNNFRLIGPGPNNNLQAHQNLHITFNANGEITTIVENTRFDCN